MKKISKVCAVAMLSLSLCACGDEKAPAKSEDVTISITENIPSGENVYDQEQEMKVNIRELYCYEKLKHKKRFDKSWRQWYDTDS